MLKPITISYPVLPAKDEAERAALRPIGRNRERYQAAISGLTEIIQVGGIKCILYTSILERLTTYFDYFFDINSGYIECQSDRFPAHIYTAYGRGRSIFFRYIVLELWRYYWCASCIAHGDFDTDI